MGVSSNVQCNIQICGPVVSCEVGHGFDLGGRKQAENLRPSSASKTKHGQFHHSPPSLAITAKIYLHQLICIHYLLQERRRTSYFTGNMLRICSNKLRLAFTPQTGLSAGP